jgi:hypothetical protein
MGRGAEIGPAARGRANAEPGAGRGGSRHVKRTDRTYIQTPKHGGGGWLVAASRPLGVAVAGGGCFRPSCPCPARSLHSLSPKAKATAKQCGAAVVYGYQANECAMVIQFAKPSSSVLEFNRARFKSNSKRILKISSPKFFIGGCC